MWVAVTIHLTGTEGKADSGHLRAGASAKERPVTFERPEALRQRMTEDMVSLVRGMSAPRTGLNVRKWRKVPLQEGSWCP